jgi:tetratricopeptide (TPR) repeat protein
MGVVYRARDTALGRDVAVKLLSDGYPPDSPAAQRFLTEARITGQLQHPGIPAVHQVGTLADGRPFLAMKLIKGSTLEAILKQRTDPSADRGRLLAIFEAVCQAVGYAHAHHVIHRDLKPANVMVGAFGEVQVMDWGLAKVLGEETTASVETRATEETHAWTQVSPTPETGSHTEAGSLVGTPGFIPPEQAVGQIERVNERSDVFGLGALLAVILTGKPPYVGERFESVRVQAVRGKLEDCFARLDASGAEPELVALCKKCLAFEPADRPADAGAVATTVAGLRTAADERARRVELDAARAAERQKRRRLAAGAAAALAVAAGCGLIAVLSVQRRANADLAAKNHELADEQAQVQERFELAQRAIAMFHTGVSEDMLLKNEQFKELRMKLLKEAAGFYADLEKLLAGRIDARSRKALAAGYFQLGELTAKIGSKPEALAVHRKALSVRRELAAAEGADVETRLDVARSLRAMGSLLQATGERTGALAAFEEQRAISTSLDAESSTDAVRAVLAWSHTNIGVLLEESGKPAEALETHRKALAIRQKLAGDNPSITQFQTELAGIHNNIGIVLSRMGKPAEALEAYRQALAIRQALANANPDVTLFQVGLAIMHNNIAIVLSETGKRAEALDVHRQALAIRQRLADANPALTEFQSDLLTSRQSIGLLLFEMGRPVEALEAHRQALAVRQKLADANPTATEFQSNLAWCHHNIGVVLSEMGKAAEALEAYRQALAIRQKLADANPTVTRFQSDLAFSHYAMGILFLKTGKPAEPSFRQAVAIMERLPTLTPPEYFNLACYSARLAGTAAEAGSGMTAVQRRDAADKAMAALRRAFAAGHQYVAGMRTDTDLDVLRSREDFQKLLAELDKKSPAKREKKP